MTNFASATIILFVNEGKTDSQIWSTVRSLGKSGWRAQVLLVDPENKVNSGNDRITFRPIPKTCISLKEAIGDAGQDLIAIVDPQFNLESEHWNLLAERSETVPVQANYSTNRQSNRFSRFFMTLYSLIIRVLFRTGKHDSNSGVTIIRKSAIASSVLHLPNPSESVSSTFEITLFLNACRQNNILIEESQTALIASTTSDGAEPTNSNANPLEIAAKCCVTARLWWNTIMFPKRYSASSESKPKKRTQFSTTLLLSLTAAFIFFGNLNYPLFEPDESRNAQLALNVLESGDWLSLSLMNESYWDKPPLQIWAIATSYSVFGESPFATRFPIALASFLTVIVVLQLAKPIVGFRAALLGAAALTLCGGFVVTGRYVTMDATLTLLTTTTFLLGYLATIADRSYRQKRFLFGAGIACGLGIMVKGPVILVLCAPPLFLNLWLSPQRQSIRWRWFFLPLTMVAMPWYVATSLVHPEFLGYFFWKHHVVRFSDAFNHREPTWYYWIGIFIFMFPVSYLLPSVVKFISCRQAETRLQRTSEMGFLFLAAIWIIGFFSISESKLPTYIVPAFPLVCLLIGAMLETKIFSNSANQRELRSTFLERLVPRVPVELLFWCSVCILATHRLFPEQSMTLLFSSLILIGVGTLAGLAVRKSGSPKIAWSAFAVIGACIVVLLTQLLGPAIAHDRSIYAAARELQQQGEFQNSPIVFYGRESYGSKLSLNQELVFNYEFEAIGDACQFLLENPRAIIVSSKDEMALLRNSLPWSITLHKQSDARHIYLSRLSPSVAERTPHQRKIR